MAYDPLIQPVADALGVADDGVKALRRDVATLAAENETLRDRIYELEHPVDPPPPPPPPTLNRKLIGLSIPDGELLAGLPAMVQRIKALGVTFVRTDIRYENIRSYGLGYYDTAIRTLRANGIQVLGILGGDLKWPTQPDADAFAVHAAEVVAWLRDRDVHTIQWGNEKNHASRVTQPENYARAIRAAYPAVKAANPNVFVVACGLSAINDSVNGHISTVDWLRRSYASGAKGNYDAQAIHPYSYPFDLYSGEDWTGWGNMVKRFRPYMEANGEGGLKVWATEAGFPTDGAGNYTAANQKALYADRLRTEIDKLAWLGPLFHYSLVDRDASSNRESRFGIYNSNWSEKPALPSLRAAVAAYPAA